MMSSINASIYASIESNIKNIVNEILKSNQTSFEYDKENFLKLIEQCINIVNNIKNDLIKELENNWDNSDFVKYKDTKDSYFSPAPTSLKSLYKIRTKEDYVKYYCDNINDRINFFELLKNAAICSEKITLSLDHYKILNSYLNNNIEYIQYDVQYGKS